MRGTLSTSLVAEVSQRLQLQRGPTPTETSRLTRNLVFYGPPGTGKTHIAKLLAQALTAEERPSKDGHWRLLQFHPSYAYEDFIQGLRPDFEHTSLIYKIVTGPFLEICQNASDDPDNDFVLVIDEISRGDPARIFGELLYALEYRGEEVELPLGGLPLCVPPNLIILGTMNSVDRSVALVDYALRRRFGFVRVDPDPEVITQTVSENSQLAAAVLESLNSWLVQTLDKEHTIGHSFFLNPSYHPFTPSTLEQIYTLDIAPLLEEYFDGNDNQMREAHLQWIRAVKMLRPSSMKTTIPTLDVWEGVPFA